MVGGGPAGSACAIEARRRGMDVTLVDRAVFPRDKSCGDGPTAHALRLPEYLGFRPDARENRWSVEPMALRSPSGRVVEDGFAGRGVFSAVHTRLDMDASLLDLAHRDGIVVHEGAEFEEVLRNDGSGVEIRCERVGVLAARAVSSQHIPARARWIGTTCSPTGSGAPRVPAARAAGIR